MDVQFFGANCVSLSGQGTRLVIDDRLIEMGGKPIVKAGDVALFSGPHPEPVDGAKMTIDCPGEYEIAAASVTGIPARAHLDETKQRSSTIYKIVLGDVRTVVLGHIYPSLSDAELERIGVVDVLVVPVGGHGYTLDAAGALDLIKKLEPKLVIPTYYADSALSFPVPAQSLDEALRELSMEPKERTAKLRIKLGDLEAVTNLVVVEKS